MSVKFLVMRLRPACNDTIILVVVSYISTDMFSSFLASLYMILCQQIYSSRYLVTKHKSYKIGSMNSKAHWYFYDYIMHGDLPEIYNMKLIYLYQTNTRNNSSILQQPLLAYSTTTIS